MYPRNAASPPSIAIGAVVQISDGAVQTTGVTVYHRTSGTTENTGGGTTSVGATTGMIYYTPTQAETDFTSFEVVAFKTGCIPVAQTIVTSASNVAGYGGVDWSKINAPTTTVDLSGTTVATVTSQLTAAQIATGVWQDATAGDFTVASSIGKALYIANIAPGGSGGHMISGSNSGTTTLAALTVTGSFTISDGLLIARSTGNSSAITATGNGTGSGAIFTSGAGATGDGVQMTAASTNGNGLALTKTGSGNALASPTTNMVLAKTTNITGFNDIAATAIVSAGAITTSGGAVSTVTTLTNLPAITANWLTATGIDANAITAAKIATGAIDADALAADAVDLIWDEVVDGSVTARQSMRLHNSAMGAKASGLATTTAVYRDLADTKDRITATVDADGNRSAVTTDLT